MSHCEGHVLEPERTMLLAVEVLDTVARFLILSEVGLVFRRVELGLVVPLGVLALLTLQFVD